MIGKLENVLRLALEVQEQTQERKKFKKLMVELALATKM